MKRLFAAVHILPSAGFREYYDDLRRQLGFARITWVKPENIHLTLKFFGETEEGHIPEIGKVLQLAALLNSPFTIHSGNLGIFGSSYQPKVVWIGIEGNPELARLAVNVLEGAEQAGWERDRQNFVPHVTLGRIKDVVDRKLFQAVIDSKKGRPAEAYEVREFHLYESILRAEGPVYRILETYKL
jgi:2'-5' RNA ligase